jgi:hypothetical protein
MIEPQWAILERHLDGGQSVRLVSCLYCEREPLPDGSFRGGLRAHLEPNPYADMIPDKSVSGARWMMRYGRCGCFAAPGRGAIPADYRYPWPYRAVKWTETENADLEDWKDERVTRAITDDELALWRRKAGLERPPAEEPEAPPAAWRDER